MYNYDSPTMHGSGIGWGFGIVLVCLLFSGLMFAAVMYVLRNHIHTVESPRLSPSDIVRERYAKGEITKVEFDQLKKDVD